VSSIGDAIDAMLALSVVRTAQEAEIPSSVTAQMYANVAVDFGIGLIPIIGDIGDILYKCNTRNTILLEKYLRNRGAANVSVDMVLLLTARQAPLLVRRLTMRMAPTSHNRPSHPNPRG